MFLPRLFSTEIAKNHFSFRRGKEKRLLALVQQASRLAMAKIKEQYIGIF